MRVNVLRNRVFARRLVEEDTFNRTLRFYDNVSRDSKWIGEDLFAETIPSLVPREYTASVIRGGLFKVIMQVKLTDINFPRETQEIIMFDIKSEGEGGYK